MRLFLIEKAERGTGLAQQQLDACIGFAKAAGYRRIRLWTREIHRAACRLYARNACQPRQTRSERSFGQDLVELVWDRAL